MKHIKKSEGIHQATKEEEEEEISQAKNIYLTRLIKYVSQRPRKYIQQ